MSKEFYDLAVDWIGELAKEAEAHDPSVGIFSNPEFAAYLRTLPDANLALKNCMLLAMREAHRAKDDNSPWHSILKFCAQGGVRPSPLRGLPDQTTGEQK